MTDKPDAVPPGLADLPLEVRRAREVETFREQQEGIARRYETIAADERALAAGALAQLLRAAPTIRAVLARSG